MIRTRRTKRSNWVVISNFNVLSAVKTSLFGIIVLLVMSVSVSTAFVESAYAEEDDPIRIILDITHQNILDSIAESELGDIEAAELLVVVEEKYDEAIAALEADPLNVVDAKKSTIMAMESFEDIAEGIGALENQASTQLPPGFGAAIDSASDEGITNGQGLGVGGIPPGILKQITAANMFGIQEQITDLKKDIVTLQGLDKSNNLNINFELINVPMNLAIEILVRGDIPNAAAQLLLADQIKNELYAEIQVAAAANSISGIEELLEDQDNLGLTKKEIRELEELSEDLSTVSSNTSENSNEGETSEDAPGNSGNAPRQNIDEDNSSENGFAIGNELGSGKIPPGLAKLFGYDDGTGDHIYFEAPGALPPGFGAAIGSVSAEGLANGQGLGLGKIPRGIYIAFNDKPDDFFENHFEAAIDGTFEGTYDGTNRGHSSGKGLYGASPLKSGAPGSFIADEKSGGKKPFCAGKALFGIPIIFVDSLTFVNILSGPYNAPDFRACDIGILEITDDVEVKVDGDVNGSVDVGTDGIYLVTYNVNSTLPGPLREANTVTITILVGPNTAPTKINDIPNQNVIGSSPDFVIDLTDIDSGAPVVPVFTDAQETSSELTYTVTDTFSGKFQSISISGTTLTIDYKNGPTGIGTGDITITATDFLGETASETFTVTVS